MRARSISPISVGFVAGFCALAAGGTALGQGGRAGAAPAPAAAAGPVTPVFDRIEVQPNPSAKGAERELQRQIAAEFSRQPHCPPERINEYAWLNSKAAARRGGPLLTGWRGTVEVVTRTPEGWLVRVNVTPRLADGLTAVRQAGDGWYSEEYLYTDGRLTFRRAVPPPRPGRPMVLVW